MNFLMKQISILLAKQGKLEYKVSMDCHFKGLEGEKQYVKHNHYYRYPLNLLII